jgi:hypothetical protein
MASANVPRAITADNPTQDTLNRLLRPLTLTFAPLEPSNWIHRLRLIRFRGHLPKGGYDVQTDGRDAATPAAAAIR